MSDTSGRTGPCPSCRGDDRRVASRGETDRGGASRGDWARRDASPASRGERPFWDDGRGEEEGGGASWVGASGGLERGGAATEGAIIWGSEPVTEVAPSAVAGGGTAAAAGGGDTGAVKGGGLQEKVFNWWLTKKVLPCGSTFFSQPSGRGKVTSSVADAGP